MRGFFSAGSWLLGALSLASGSAPATATSGSGLRMEARIDGVDELRIGRERAEWVHLGWAWPPEVRLGGERWVPEQGPVLNRPLLPAECDFASAVVLVEQARGAVGFRHEKGELVLTFDDGELGGDALYVLEIAFADELCARSRESSPGSMPRTPPELELPFRARIDGIDEVHLSAGAVDWLHYAWDWPSIVELGSYSWNPWEQRAWVPPDGPLWPHDASLENAFVELRRARGIVELVPGTGGLFLRIDDGALVGSDDYELVLRIPRARTAAPERLHRVEVRVDPALAADVPLLAQELAGEEPREVPGLRGLDESGRCVLALAAGTYRFSVQSRPEPNLLVALRTGDVRVSRDRDVELEALSPAVPELRGPDGADYEWKELAIRSAGPTGEVAWKREDTNGEPRVALSPGHEYAVRAFGEREGASLAYWGSLRGDKAPRLACSKAESFRCTFGWRRQGAGNRVPDPPGRWAELLFPNGSLRLDLAGSRTLWTNRAGFSLAYGYELGPDRSVRFHPRLYELGEPGHAREIELGGELALRGYAAVLENENLEPAGGEQLWWDVALLDPGGHALDEGGSEVSWTEGARLRSGAPLPPAPLDASGRVAIADPLETVELWARLDLGEERELTCLPEAGVEHSSQHFTTTLPEYLAPLVREYLAKCERVYASIVEARGREGPPQHRIAVRWWLNSGAVGVLGSITMPIQGLLEDRDPYGYPWALAHECLHGFGYAHGPEQERLDAEAKRLFGEWRWEAGDRPSGTAASR